LAPGPKSQKSAKLKRKYRCKNCDITMLSKYRHATENSGV
jgi:hypothetical protein